MNCPACNVEIKVISGDELTNHYEPVKESLSSYRESFIIPFSCSLCGSIKMKYRPVRDVVMVWPYPAPEKTNSGIFLPEDTEFIGGAYKEQLRPNKAIILGVGPGYFNSKKRYFVPCRGVNIGDVVYFNKKVMKSWTVELKNDAGIKHPVTLCGFMDIYGFESE